MHAKCIEVRYVEGKFGRINEAELDRCVRQGWVVQSETRGSTGRYNAVFPSRLILVMDTDGGRRESRVDTFFKNRIGRLSKRRRDAIIGTMPASVSVTGKYGRGGPFLAVSWNDLQQWAARAEEVLGPKRRR